MLARRMRIDVAYGSHLGCLPAAVHHCVGVKMVRLQGKDDFEEVLQRFEAWWRCEIVDRPLVSINVRSDRSANEPTSKHGSLRDRWFDVDYALDRFESLVESSVFLAETLPVFVPNLGPDVCATVFGCELAFTEDSSWSRPVVSHCREIPEIKPNLKNEYWLTLRRMTELSLQRGQGKWLTGVADLHTNGDLVAALRDPQGVCLDLADDMPSVRRACDYITRSYPLMFEDLWSRIAVASLPCTTWTPCLHTGSCYPVSCDFICMISPEMFAETILPALIAEINYLDRSIFHLDGPGALKHLDALLALDDLDGLQWIYGAGNGPARRWIDVYRKAQAAGKCLQICTDDLNDAMAVAESLNPDGLWFCPAGQYSRGEAEAFIGKIARCAAGKR